MMFPTHKIRRRPYNPVTENLSWNYSKRIQSFLELLVMRSTSIALMDLTLSLSLSLSRTFKADIDTTHYE